MSILESTREMTTNEKMFYEMGYAQGKQDAMPVVRCKDCKHYDTIGCSKGIGWCKKMDIGANDNFYCANGKQLNKESEDD